MENENNKTRVDQIPLEIPILPLRNAVLYPFSVMPLIVGIKRSKKLVEDAAKDDRIIGIVTTRDSSVSEPQPGETYEIGTTAKIEHISHMNDGNLEVLVRGLDRFHVDHWLATEPYLNAHIELQIEMVDKDLEMEALAHTVRSLSNDVFRLSKKLPKEVGMFLNQVQDPVTLVYLVAHSIGMVVEKAQAILEERDVKKKFHLLISHLSHEKEVLSLGEKIQTQAREGMDKAHREYYLRQQLKAIKEELGETPDETPVEDEYREKIEKADLPEEASKEALRELKRLSGMSPQSPEFSVIRTYLDWILALPWKEKSEDQSDIDSARKVLDEDHFGLEEVKERIIEYLAVRKLSKDRAGEQDSCQPMELKERCGAILCFAGPPGVGKTSLGQSIARALGRRFSRMSLGGMRDEAEIRGHRRTYIGAMPGRIIQALKRAGTNNPVFMLDEVDKIGNDWRGDPGSALLEVLDPAQNFAFRDHYLDVDFDLSDVIFITTANQLETIPPALRDRMEIITLDGYTEHEKIQIARDHLAPRQLEMHGLREEEVAFDDEAFRKVVHDYTREAGVRNLDRRIGSICRKVAVKIAAKELTQVTVTPELVREYLKKEPFESELSETMEIPGIATGLAVTSVGGDILFIEATGMKGSGKLTLTGQLGDVMRESAQIAHSYVRSKAIALGFNPSVFSETDVHVHVPAGAVPKDGPSAGVALVMAIASLFSDRPLKNNLAMTGEVTLRGRVLPVGGIKLKLLAAHRAGMKTVILPKRNERDLDELPEEVLNDLEIVFVEKIADALDVALQPKNDQEEFAMAANG
jgi:ATP-dependent Lon protease